MRKVRKSPDSMTFLEHLEDLRKRIFYSFLAVVISVIPAWFFHKQLYAILAVPITKYLPEGKTLTFISLTAPFMLYIKVSFLAAILFASPFVFIQIWYFISPGLYKKERKAVIPFVLFSSLFFISGAVFAYFIVFPFAVRFFLSMGEGFEPIITVDQYFSLALRVILGIALVFELPTLVYFFSRFGIITAKMMIKYFKYAVLVVFIIAAVITPTPDPITQTIVALPMLGLYGFSILIALAVGKKKEKKRKQEEEDLAG
ncbi:MAG: twin-arginine translocase subunit TatC [Candidatus Aminicenantes bacterium]